MDLKLRQRWKFKGVNKFEKRARVTICKIMRTADSEVFYVRVSELFRAGGELEQIFFAIDRDALEASLGKLVDEVPLDDMDMSWRMAFSHWQENKGVVFQIPVVEIIEAFERSVTDGVEVDDDGEPLS